MPGHRAGPLVFPLTLLLTLALAISACGGAGSTPTPTSTPISSDSTEGSLAELPDKIVAPHFVDSYPAHGDTLAKLPQEVVLNFNFNLHPDSSIAVTHNGAPITVGSETISVDQLSMRALIEGGEGDGVIQVTYKACWPDRSCHEGSVAFFVDGTTLSQYLDLRRQSEVTVYMRGGERFDPARIIISSRTTVTWTNDEDNLHFVNTDPHPSHNVLSDLNSSVIRQGESYSYTFMKPGAWGYHCSAHYNLGMTAQVIVT